jgi:hypothetical protein
MSGSANHRCRLLQLPCLLRWVEECLVHDMLKPRHRAASAARAERFPCADRQPR